MERNQELFIQVIQAFITLIGLFFIWYQIRRGRKDSMTGSIVSSLNERKLEIEKRKSKIKSEEQRIYYKFLIPRLNKKLKKKYNGNLKKFAKNYTFNKVDWELTDKEEIFKIIIREYSELDFLFSLFEEQFIAAKYLKLVDNKTWKYWEFYIKATFYYKQNRNHWKLRDKENFTFTPFYYYIKNECIDHPPSWDDVVLLEKYR